MAEERGGMTERREGGEEGCKDPPLTVGICNCSFSPARRGDRSAGKSEGGLLGKGRDASVRERGREVIVYYGHGNARDIRNVAV